MRVDAVVTMWTTTQDRKEATLYVLAATRRACTIQWVKLSPGTADLVHERAARQPTKAFRTHTRTECQTSLLIFRRQLSLINQAFSTGDIHLQFKARSCRRWRG
mmetsp:Transcript_42526/g.99143  ORF Transcript_42526/g.99143 Transcript_42526/m.99143 type:complete len:104 (+) Transcript_42526:413-724(+)